MEKVISKLLGVEISKLEDCSGLNTAKEIDPEGIYTFHII